MGKNFMVLCNTFKAMKHALTLWRFSRPHTLIGSTLSILAIFLIAAGNYSFNGQEAHVIIPDLIRLFTISLISALACNIYITGLNQWSDVEVDKVNKPWLPIASGELSRRNGLIIVIVCGVISISIAVFYSLFFAALILSILAIGTAYSLPPLKFKRNHIAAASSIALVRGLLVNIGFYLHFYFEMFGKWQLDKEIWPLVVFVAAFSLGIAWFKDIPDTKGDEKFDFGTLAVKAGRQRAFIAGVIVVSFAYSFILFMAATRQLPNPVFYFISHLIALSLFLYQSNKLKVNDDKKVKRFYMFFWGLFFAEYIIYPLGFYV